MPQETRNFAVLEVRYHKRNHEMHSHREEGPRNCFDKPSLYGKMAASRNFAVSTFNFPGSTITLN